LSWSAALWFFRRVDENDEELKRKAERAQYILYGVMILFLIIPFVFLWLIRRGTFN
jgi:hypothetical protein